MKTTAITVRLTEGLRLLSFEAQRYMTRNPELPDCGHVIFYAGFVSGWVCDLTQDRAENGQLTHRPGCIAVPVTTTGGFFEAVGGSYGAGADRWEEITL
ncbi:MAG: hypothetical protein NDI75_07600 [Candidatus Didemnitutus sp.]|nr:hypothetical protein [Candidatus Didemnitutus sp.]